MEVNKLKKIYPFIDELVDALYNSELNELIDKHVSSEICDYKSFMLYIIMYFLMYLEMKSKYNTDELKVKLKEYMTDIIQNPEKRKMCINMFLQYQQTIENNILQLK